MSLSNYVTPSQMRYLRACMVCSIVQLHARFRAQGCPNCESFLQLQGSEDAIQDCTSQVFDGMITLANPADSWVAKWQRLESYVPGIYAVKVVGILPDEIIGTMEDAGVKYIPRDGSAQDNEPTA